MTTFEIVIFYDLGRKLSFVVQITGFRIFLIILYLGDPLSVIYLLFPLTLHVSGVDTTPVKENALLPPGRCYRAYLFWPKFVKGLLL